ncbi:MAG TPA: NAD(P)H-binding protein, partial [Polyangiales bacterium]|nr:NAD(P)H-binding protein [Polyangiales bacterium]
MILVTGASGTIGRALVRQLKERGLPFKAFVRSEAKGSALACEYSIGDFDNAESVTRALQGVDAVFVNGPAGE